jgi:molybdopterin synthase catalytic subunit
MAKNTLIAITTDHLDTASVANFLSVPEAGALDIFLGTTRQWTRGRETTRLVYECYEPMAVAEMERLADECRSRWPVLQLCMLHRLGEVPVAEASVIIGVSTPHRKDAFEACRFLIDQLKKQVPIWKYEVFTDGSGEWVSGEIPEVHAETRAQTDPST